MSNDNPFSEAQFKTLKYVHDFPHHFNTLAEARIFCYAFFTKYNHVHHSGIGWYTPAWSTTAQLRRSPPTPSLRFRHRWQRTRPSRDDILGAIHNQRRHGNR